MRMFALLPLALTGCSFTPADGTWDTRNPTLLADTCDQPAEEGEFLLTNSDEGFTVSVDNEDTGDTIAIPCTWDSKKDALCTTVERADAGGGFADVTVVVTVDVAVAFDYPESLTGIINYDFACEGADCSAAATLTGLEPCATSTSFEAFWRQGQ